MKWKTAAACLILLLSISATGCRGPLSGDHKEAIAVVNGQAISAREYHTRLTSEMEMEKNYKISLEAREAFLDTMIEQEILIQEAIRKDLDKTEAFVSAMESYWEATLIKRLMEQKNQEIKTQIYVTEADIRQRYEKLKQKNTSLPPLPELEQEIAEQLKAEKRTGLFKAWLNTLKHNASVRIDKTHI